MDGSARRPDCVTAVRTQSRDRSQHYADSEARRARVLTITAWLAVTVSASFVLVQVLTLLAVAFAIVTTVWWIYREVEHRVERNAAEMAPVTHLRPASTGQRDLKNTSTHALWRGPSAA